MRMERIGLRRGIRAVLVLVSILFMMQWTAYAAPPRPFLSASPNPSVYGQPFTLAASFEPLYYDSWQPGSIAFSIDGMVIGTVTPTLSTDGSLVQASFTVTTAAIVASLSNPIYLVGTHTLTAVYSGGDVPIPMTVTADQTIIGQPSVSSIVSLDQNIYYGQEIGYDFGVDAILGAAPADPSTEYGVLDGGNLYTYIDTTLVCTISYNVGGRCADAPFEGYQVGTYVTYVVYNGNQYFASSTSPMYPVTVMQDTTATTLTSSGSPLQPLTLTASVAASYPGAVAGTVFPTVTGTVQFLDGLTPIGTATVNAQGVATLTTSTLLVGTHLLSACYQNSLNFMPSCSPVLTHVVAVANPPVATVTLLTSSLNPSIVGQAITFTAAVETTGAIPATPAGSVTFYDGATPLQTVMLNAKGIATFTTSSLAAGIHAITAVYAGNTATAASTSAVLNQVVLTALPQENAYLLIVTPTALSVGVGGSVTATVAVVGVNTAGQPFQLGCSLLPGESTCSFGQPTLPANGGTTTLTIATTAPHACGASTSYFVAQNGATSKKETPLPWLALTGVLLLCTRRRTRRLRAILLSLLLCVLVSSGAAPLIGCGACTNVGTQPLQYSFLVNATAQGQPSTNRYATISQAVTLNVHL